MGKTKYIFQGDAEMSTVDQVYSGPAIVYPHEPLIVVTDPVSVEALDGEEFTMTAAFSGGTAPIAYQWQELLVAGSWANISGQTTLTLTHTATIAREQAQYRCYAEGQHNQPVWTASAVLSGTLPAFPTITIAPLAPSVTEGDTIAFTSVSAGSGALTYQWYHQGIAVSGATADFYNRPTVLADNGSLVTCNVTDGHGQVTASAPATLTVAADIPEPGYTYAMPMVASLWDVVDGASGGDIVNGNYHIETNGNFGAGGASNVAIAVSVGVPYIFSSNRVSPSHSQFHWGYQVGSAPGLGDVLDVVKSPATAGVVSYEFTPTVSPVYLTIRFDKSDGFDFGSLHWADVSVTLA